jgi:hypothetical protein
MRLLGIASIGLLAGLLAAPLAAQATAKDPCGSDSAIPFARIGLRRLCELARRPDVRAATGAADGLELMGKVPPDILQRLPDSALSAFIGMFAETLSAVPKETCARYAGGPTKPDWNTQFMALALTLDSTMSVRWADALEAWVGVVVRRDPPRPTASAERATASLRRLLADIPVAEAAALKRQLSGAGLPEADACALAISLFRRLGSPALAEPGPVLRALMAGRVSIPSPG